MADMDALSQLKKSGHPFQQWFCFDMRKRVAHGSSYFERPDFRRNPDRAEPVRISPEVRHRNSHNPIQPGYTPGIEHT